MDTFKKKRLQEVCPLFDRTYFRFGAIGPSIPFVLTKKQLHLALIHWIKIKYQPNETQKRILENGRFIKIPVNYSLTKWSNEDYFFCADPGFCHNCELFSTNNSTCNQCGINLNLNIDNQHIYVSQSSCPQLEQLPVLHKRYRKNGDKFLKNIGKFEEYIEIVKIKAKLNQLVDD